MGGVTLGEQLAWVLGTIIVGLVLGYIIRRIRDKYEVVNSVKSIKGVKGFAVYGKIFKSEEEALEYILKINLNKCFKQHNKYLYEHGYSYRLVKDTLDGLISNLVLNTEFRQKLVKILTYRDEID